MSEIIQVVAIITPAEGKFDVVKKSLAELASEVEKSEPDVTCYQMFEQYNSEGVNVIVVQETYKNQETIDAHFKTNHFQALGKKFTEEKLLAGPLDIKTIKPFAGFSSRS